MIPIFDNGHGGLIGGVYQTQGKRSPDWGKGILYEGVFNRDMVNRLIKRCVEHGIMYYHVSNTEKDISLNNRVAAANKIYKECKQAGVGTYFVSVHANAGGGTGWEVFTSTGQSKSDKIADVFIKQLKQLPILMRADLSDGDEDKEADFYVLRKTSSPAILIECAFMDNQKDYDLLWNEDFRTMLADYLFNAIYNLYKTGI